MKLWNWVLHQVIPWFTSLGITTRTVAGPFYFWLL